MWLPRMSVFSLVCECVCVSMWFLRWSGVGCEFLKGARQLPFTAAGGNKQWGRHSYLPLLLGKKAEEGALLRSHCNSPQLQGKKRNKELIRKKMASLNSSVRNPSLSLFNCCIFVCVYKGVNPGSSIFLPCPFFISSSLNSPLCVRHICCQSAATCNPTGISCRWRHTLSLSRWCLGQVNHCPSQNGPLFVLSPCSVTITTDAPQMRTPKGKVQHFWSYTNLLWLTIAWEHCHHRHVCTIPEVNI